MTLSNTQAREAALLDVWHHGTQHYAFHTRQLTMPRGTGSGAASTQRAVFDVSE